MSREVRRVPLDWEHPTEWRERFDCGEVRMMSVPRPLYRSTYAEAMSIWEQERAELLAHEGFDWQFGVKYHLTGYQGRDDSAPTIHPYEGETVRDEAHLEQLLLAEHDEGRPDPADYMPDFAGVPDEAMGLRMYSTISEGTPISPAFRTPEELARWLADTGASAFAGMTATYEQWLATCRSGWAPSAVACGGNLVSGVEFMGGER